jgi:hypothetical protein
MDPRSTSSARGLVLNVTPIHLTEGSRVQVASLPYESRAQLRDLRRQHGQTVVFLRTGNNIVGAHIRASSSFKAEALQDRRLADEPRLTGHLVEHALVSRLAALQRKVVAINPICFLSENQGDDVVAAVGAKLPPWLRIRLGYQLHVRVIHPRERPPETIIVADTHVLHQIDKSASELIAVGVELRGLYVAEDESVAGEAFRRRRLLGRVEAVDGGNLVLGDSRPGRDRVAASSVFLEPRLEATERCLEALLGNTAAKTIRAIDECTLRLQGAASRIQHIRATLGFFAREALALGPNATAQVGELVSENQPGFPALMSASRVTYVFDPRGVRVSGRNADGLERHGPYTSRASFNRTPRICVIAQEMHKGAVEKFLYKFFEGIERSIYPKGLRGLFRMDLSQPTFFTAPNATPAAYRQAAQQALEEAATSGKPWDLAVVQVWEGTRALRGDHNPYLVTKAAFINHQIPVQEFRVETMQQPDESLAYSLRNLALATYAKLGGTPWLLKTEPTTSHELVVGLGSAWTSGGRLGERERLVGITTLFSGDGNYWLHTLSRAVPMDEYREAVAESVKRAVERIRRERNWSKGDHVRLIFHAFKPFKNGEADAVLSLASQFTDFNVEVAFVHVNADSPYLLFDTANEGGKNGRGALVPARGPIIELGDRQALVLVTGAAELKRPGMGMPRPLLLELHPKSSFKDLRYLSDQVFLFASHSWRGFLPAQMPVTVGYSQQIARLLGRLRDVSTWSPDSLYGKIGFTRWFL